MNVEGFFKTWNRFSFNVSVTDIDRSSPTLENEPKDLGTIGSIRRQMRSKYFK